MAWLSRYEQTLLSILRIVSGLLFLEHGLQKIVNFPPMPAAMAHAIPSGMMPVIVAAGVIEIVAGVLITVGLFTRWAAFIASGEMAVAYWMVHARTSPFPSLNQGDAAILFCFIFLYIAAAGPGSLALSRK